MGGRADAASQPTKFTNLRVNISIMQRGEILKFPPQVKIHFYKSEMEIW